MTPEKAIEYLEKPFATDHNGKEFVEALKMAKEALRKQIPMRRVQELDITGKPIMVCGNCGDSTGGGWLYCSWCGQKVDV